LRSAANSAEFIAESEKLGIDIEIVSGLREAELIYHGVKWSYDFKEPGVIMDIGGGSTEFIFADLQGVQDMISLNIGVSRIYQKMKIYSTLRIGWKFRLMDFLTINTRTS
jgi:exopolyphosphatase/guanosine-5'-triphosphate,3'-diphosphate pyrophosphatase